MPLAGFEPTIPVFKRAETFHALDRAATVTGQGVCLVCQIICYFMDKQHTREENLMILLEV
jgi:hypothetical protein